MTNDNTQQSDIFDPIKESYLTAEIYKEDRRVKKKLRMGKNKPGLRYINSIDFNDMTEEDIVERLSESWNPKNGYKFEIIKTYVKRKNVMSGEMFYERYDTPYYCSPSSERYWCM